MRKVSILACLLFAVIVSASQMSVLAQPSQSYDIVYQEIDFEARVASAREARARYSITMRNIQIKDLKSWSPGLDSRFASPGYSLSITRVYDSVGDLDYELTDGRSPSLKVVFRKTVALGESYGFTYEYTVKWDYNSYRWTIGWSTSRIIEKAKLKISVSEPLRIIRTYPAGLFSDDRKSAEMQATNVQRTSLGIYCPPTTGKWSILALLVEFPDMKHQTAPEEISKRIFQDVNAYFREVSYNLISIEGYATSWIMLPKPTATYGISEWGSPSERRRAFERDAIGVADNLVDYSRYDVVFIIAAGRGTVWAYSTTATIRTNDSVTVEAITVQTEYTAWGTFAHEFGHQLGLPDLYDYTVAAKPGVYLEAAIHVGSYCLMSRSTERPLMLGWCKVTLGWVPPSNVQVVQPGNIKSIKIRPHRSLSNETMLLKIQISPKQYYLVEVRERTGYDSVLPDEGVLIIFVDELLESGQGPIRLIDANPATKSLDDAPFDLGPGENAVFTNFERGIGLVLQQKARDGYLIHLTKAEQVEEARELSLESRNKIEQAEAEIAKARVEGRLEELNQAAKELEQAKYALSQGNYRQAISHASNALGIAQKAYRASQLTFVPVAVVAAVVVSAIVIWKICSKRKQPTTAV